MQAQSSNPTGVFSNKSKRQQNKSPDTSLSQAKLPHPTDRLPTAPRLMRVRWFSRFCVLCSVFCVLGSGFCVLDPLESAVTALRWFQQ